MIQTLLLSYLIAHKKVLNICAISCFTISLEEIERNGCILIVENIFSGLNNFLQNFMTASGEDLSRSHELQGRLGEYYDLRNKS